jgi:hypothetical protein
MEEEFRAFKMPKVDVKVEKIYSLSIAGKSLGRFREVGKGLCGMKQLTGPDGSIVIDCPTGMDEIIQTLLVAEEEMEPFKAGVVKASPAIVGAMQAIIEDARRTPARTTEAPEGEQEPDLTPRSHPVVIRRPMPSPEQK